MPEGVAVVRVMPNTPALVDEGMAAVSPGSHCDESHLAEAEELMASVGKVLRIPERQQDAVTAISGSGPAYIFFVVESMIEAGVHLGLPRTTATELVIQTLVGSAKMLRETGTHPTVLREQVTSPGGTTASALRELEVHKVRAAFLAAMEAARDRSRSWPRATELSPGADDCASGRARLVTWMRGCRSCGARPPRRPAATTRPTTSCPAPCCSPVPSPCGAPAELTWRWLCQVAVAPYSYDWIDNRGRRSPHDAHPGRRPAGARPDDGHGLPADAFDDGHHWTAITTPRGQRMFGPVAMTYAAEPDGPDSRIVCRIAAGAGGPLAGVRAHALAWGDLVMMRRQFLNLKALAERDVTRSR